MKDNKTEEKIFDLISNKKFSQLTEEEKKLVLSQMTEADFTAMAELNLSVAATMKESTPFEGAQLKKDLLAAYDKKHKHEVGTVSLFSRRVPFYQAAAAVIVAILLMAGWHFYNMPVTPAGAAIVYKTDTLYLPSKEVKDVNTAQQLVDNPAENDNSQYREPMQLQTEAANLSRSIKKDSGLKQFMVASL